MLFTLIRRECKRMIRLWLQTLASPLMGTLIFFPILYALKADLQYITPGLLASSVINNSFSNSSSSLLIARMRRNIEEMIISPTPAWAVIIGFVIGSLCRSFIITLVFCVIAWGFWDISIANPLWFALVLLLISTLFSLLGFINSVFARSFDDLAIIPNFIIAPLCHLGGTFFSLNQLTPFWKKCSQFNPMIYIIQLTRNAMLDGFTLQTFKVSGIILGFILLFSYLALKSFHPERVGKIPY